jgi:hypothetical protein
MVPIPYAMRYTATLQGQAAKLVCCEQCQFEYVYLIARKASGEGTSWLFVDNQGAQQRAQDAAAERLTAKLERARDVVPCPACGWLQKDMVERARRQRYGWMATAMAVLYPIAAARWASRPHAGINTNTQQR